MRRWYGWSRSLPDSLLGKSSQGIRFRRLSFEQLEDRRLLCVDLEDPINLTGSFDETQVDDDLASEVVVVSVADDGGVDDVADMTHSPDPEIGEDTHLVELLDVSPLDELATDIEEAAELVVEESTVDLPVIPSDGSTDPTDDIGEDDVAVDQADIVAPAVDDLETVVEPVLESVTPIDPGSELIEIVSEVVSVIEQPDVVETIAELEVVETIAELDVVDIVSPIDIPIVDDLETVVESVLESVTPIDPGSESIDIVSEFISVIEPSDVVDTIAELEVVETLAELDVVDIVSPDDIDPVSELTDVVSEVVSVIEPSGVVETIAELDVVEIVSPVDIPIVDDLETVIEPVLESVIPIDPVSELTEIVSEVVSVIEQSDVVETIAELEVVETIAELDVVDIVSSVDIPVVDDLETVVEPVLDSVTPVDASSELIEIVSEVVTVIEPSDVVDTIAELEVVETIAELDVVDIVAPVDIPIVDDLETVVEPTLESVTPIAPGSKLIEIVSDVVSVIEPADEVETIAELEVVDIVSPVDIPVVDDLETVVEPVLESVTPVAPSSELIEIVGEVVSVIEPSEVVETITELDVVEIVSPDDIPVVDDLETVVEPVLESGTPIEPGLELIDIVSEVISVIEPSDVVDTIAELDVDIVSPVDIPIVDDLETVLESVTPVDASSELIDVVNEVVSVIERSDVVETIAELEVVEIIAELDVIDIVAPVEIPVVDDLETVVEPVLDSVTPIDPGSELIEIVGEVVSVIEPSDVVETIVVEPVLESVTPIEPGSELIDIVSEVASVIEPSVVVETIAELEVVETIAEFDVVEIVSPVDIPIVDDLETVVEPMLESVSPIEPGSELIDIVSEVVSVPEQPDVVETIAELEVVETIAELDVGDIVSPVVDDLETVLESVTPIEPGSKLIDIISEVISVIEPSDVVDTIAELEVVETIAEFDVGDIVSPVDIPIVDDLETVVEPVLESVTPIEPGSELIELVSEVISVIEPSDVVETIAELEVVETIAEVDIVDIVSPVDIPVVDDLETVVEPVLDSVTPVDASSELIEIVSEVESVLEQPDVVETIAEFDVVEIVSPIDIAVVDDLETVVESVLPSATQVINAGELPEETLGVVAGTAWLPLEPISVVKTVLSSDPGPEWIAIVSEVVSVIEQFDVVESIAELDSDDVVARFDIPVVYDLERIIVTGLGSVVQNTDIGGPFDELLESASQAVDPTSQREETLHPLALAPASDEAARDENESQIAGTSAATATAGARSIERSAGQGQSTEEDLLGALLADPSVVIQSLLNGSDADLQLLHRALQNLLRAIDTLGNDLISFLAGMGIAPWMVAMAASVVAVELTRRRKQRSNRKQAGEADDTDLTIWQFPEFLGTVGGNQP